jgi:hypothetical protein
MLRCWTSACHEQTFAAAISLSGVFYFPATGSAQKKRCRELQSLLAINSVSATLGQYQLALVSAASERVRQVLDRERAAATGGFVFAGASIP